MTRMTRIRKPESSLLGGPGCNGVNAASVKTKKAARSGGFFVSKTASGAEHHLLVTFTVTLLFARLESSCGETVWTEAVFAMSWAGPEAATVSVTVA